MRVVIAHEAGADLVYSQAASAVGAAQAGSKAAARAVQPKASPVFRALHERVNGRASGAQRILGMFIYTLPLPLRLQLLRWVGALVEQTQRELDEPSTSSAHQGALTAHLAPMTNRAEPYKPQPLGYLIAALLHQP